MSERSPISPYLDNSQRLRSDSGIRSEKRIGNSLRLGSENPNGSDAASIEFLKKTPSSTFEKSIASNYDSQRSSAEQSIKSSAIGEDIINRATSVLEELLDITERQLALIDSVTSRSSRADLRQQISDEVSALATRFNETVYNTTYDTQELFDHTFSVNTSGTSALDFSVGDLLERFKSGLSGVDESTRYDPGNPGQAEVVRFDYTAGTGINETYEITFSDAGYGGGGGGGTATGELGTEYYTSVFGDEASLVDINEDGIEDIVTSTTIFTGVSEQRVYVRIGNGDGTFLAETSSLISTSTTITGVEQIVADFDGDGHLDIAMIGNKASTESVVMLAIGDGTGAFSAGVTFSGANSGSLRSTGGAAGDIDGDGDTDIIVSAYQVGTYKIGVHLNNGDGTFALGVTYSNGAAAGTTKLVDIDGDSNLDLLVNSSSSISVRLGNGDGTFKAQIAPYSDLVFTGVGDFTLADINGDTYLDIAAVGNIGFAPTTTAYTAVILGNGDGTFNAVTSYLLGGALGTDVELGDLNGDGNLDLVSISSGPNLSGRAFTSIRFGFGDGTFGAATNSENFNGNAYELSIVDINGDGANDLWAHNGSGGILRLGTYSGGDGTFATSVSYANYFTGPSYSQSEITTTDLNLDGIKDLIISGSRSIEAYLGNGDGTFKAADGHDTNGSVTIYDTAIVEISNNNNRLPEIISSEDSQIVIREWRSFNDFGTEYKYNVGQGTIYDFTLGDFNEDGYKDILLVSDTGSWVLTGNSNGSFNAAIASNFESTNSFTSVDLNADSHLDVVGFSSFDYLYVDSGQGDTTFQVQTGYYSTLNKTDFKLADIDGDFILDAVSTDTATDSVSVMIGNGDGSFKARTTFASGDGASGVALKDLNGDGNVDLVTADSNAGTVSIHLGNGDGTFKARSTAATAVGNSLVTIDDYNQDGVLDIITTGDDNYHVLLGNASAGAPSLETDDTLTIYVPGDNYGADPEKTLNFVFAIDGATPTLPGTKIDILSTDTASQIATKVAAAITAHADADYVTATANSPTSGQLTLSYGTGINSGLNTTDTVLSIGSGFTISKTQDGSPVQAGGYTRFYDGATNYDVWYSVDGVGSAPGGGGTKIQVNVNSTDTLDEVLDATILAINTSTGGNFVATHDGTRATITRTAIGTSAGSPTTHSAVGAGGISATVITAGSNPVASSGGVNATSDSIELLSHAFNTGDAVTLYGDGELPGGLESGVTYYVIRVDANNVKLASSASNAASGVAIDLTSSGSNSLTLIGQSGVATYGMGAITYDLSTDALASEAKIEANLQLDRVRGETDRINSIKGTFQGYASIANTSAKVYKRQSTEFKADKVERDASALTKDIRGQVDQALGAHTKLNPFSVLELLQDDEKDSQSSLEERELKKQRIES